MGNWDSPHAGIVPYIEPGFHKGSGKLNPSKIILPRAAHVTSKGLCDGPVRSLSVYQFVTMKNE